MGRSNGQGLAAICARRASSHGSLQCPAPMVRSSSPLHMVYSTWSTPHGLLHMVHSTWVAPHGCPNGAKCDSPGQRPGSDGGKNAEPWRGAITSKVTASPGRRKGEKTGATPPQSRVPHGTLGRAPARRAGPSIAVRWWLLTTKGTHPTGEPGEASKNESGPMLRL